MAPPSRAKSPVKRKTRDGRVSKRTSKHKKPSAKRERDPSPMRRVHSPTKKATWAGSIRQYLSRVKNYLFTSSTSIQRPCTSSRPTPGNSTASELGPPSSGKKRPRVQDDLDAGECNRSRSPAKKPRVATPAVSPRRRSPSSGKTTETGKCKSNKPVSVSKVEKAEKKLQNKSEVKKEEKRDDKRPVKRVEKRVEKPKPKAKKPIQKRRRTSDDSDSNDD